MPPARGSVGSNSSRARVPGKADLLSDASSLGAICINVGMTNEDSYGLEQDAKVQQLADWLTQWLNGGAAVVGINELHPTIAKKLAARLGAFHAGIATDETNSLVWTVCVCDIVCGTSTRHQHLCDIVCDIVWAGHTHNTCES
jgi:hypothetical protein